MMELNDKGLYNGYGMWHQPFWQTKQMELFFGVVILICFAYILYKLVRFYQKRWGARITPWEKALQDLKFLKQSCDYTPDEGKQFYYELSKIFKVYLQQRYGFNVLAKTDQEVIHYIKEQGVLSDIATDLTVVLDGAQKIKFAQHMALQDVIMHDFKVSVALIKRTIPQKKCVE